MIKYLFGSALVLVLAFYVVSYGIKKTKMSDRIDEAMDVPYGDYESLGVRQSDSGGYELFLDHMNLYATRKGKGTMCSGDIRLHFQKQDKAKLVLKFRYNIGPFLAEPLRHLKPKQAETDKAKAQMTQSLKDGYAKQYGIKTIESVSFERFRCQEIQ